MKNKIFRRITATVLSVSMLIPVSLLTACSDSELPDKNWEISEEDTSSVKELTADALYSDGKVSVTLTSSDDCFKDNVASNDIYLMEYSPSDNSEPDSDEQSGSGTSSTADESTVLESVSEASGSENATGNRIRKIDVERKSSTELVLTADAASDDAAYYIAVHKDATSDGKYAEATARTVSGSQTFDITLDKSFAISAYEDKPVITIPKDYFGEGTEITAEKLTLGGVFDNVGIDNVAVKGSNVELSLSGKAVTDGDGTVAFTSNAGNSIVITVPVLSTVARVDNSSYRYEDGKLYFDLVLIDDEYDEFTDKAEGNIKVEDKAAEVIKLSDDKKTATVAFATQAKDIDSALEEFKDKKVTVLADAVSVGMDCEASINVIDAYISAYVSDIAQYGNYVDTVFDLYINEGSVSEITKDNLSLEGDFSGNDITSVEKVSDKFYKISIRVDTSDGILGKNDGMIYGVLSLADGSLKNTRGTNSDGTSCILYAVVSNGELLPFEFSSVLKKVQVVLDATQLFGLPTGPVSKILDTFGDYAEKADTLTSLAQNCLGLAGIVDDREDVDKILDAINQLNDSIERLGQSISEIERMIQQSDVRMREAFDKQRYISYRDAWKSFTNGPMKAGICGSWRVRRICGHQRRYQCGPSVLFLKLCESVHQAFQRNLRCGNRIAECFCLCRTYF